MGQRGKNSTITGSGSFRCKKKFNLHVQKVNTGYPLLSDSNMGGTITEVIGVSQGPIS